MSHSSDSFKGNCQILVLVPRTQRHNPCLKRLQMIFPFCSWYSSFYVTLPKKPNTAQWPRKNIWFFFWFFFNYFRTQKLSKAYTICSKQQLGTRVLNLEVAHLDLCWGLLEVPSQSPEHQNKAQHLRTLCFVLLGNVSMFILSVLTEQPGSALPRRLNLIKDSSKTKQPPRPGISQVSFAWLCPHKQSNLVKG